MPVTGEICPEAKQGLGALLAHEQPTGYVGEFIASRAVDGPIGRDRLVSSEDLLDEHDGSCCPGGECSGQARGVPGRVREAVDVVHSHACHALVATELDEQAVGLLEDRRVLHPHPD